MKIQLIIILSIVFCINATAQNKRDSIIQVLTDRVEKIEKNEEFLQKELELTKREINLYSKEESLKIDTSIQELEKQHDHYLIAIIVGIILTLGLGVWLRSFIVRKSKELVEDKLDKYFEENKGKFNELIDLKDEEKEILKNKNIIVITSEKDYNITFIESFLDKMGFQNVTYIHSNEEIIQDYDLVLLNNENTNLTGEILSYIEQIKPNCILFTFGQNKIQPTPQKKWKNLASATFRSQLYGNLLSSLKYQSSMTKK